MIKESIQEEDITIVYIYIYIYIPNFGYLMRRTESLKNTLIWERLKAKEEGEAEDKMVRKHH